MNDIELTVRQPQGRRRPTSRGLAVAALLALGIYCVVGAVVSAWTVADLCIDFGGSWDYIAFSCVSPRFSVAVGRGIPAAQVIAGSFAIAAAVVIWRRRTRVD